MPYGTASAIEIDKKLRDDFRRRVKDYGISAELTDPLLSVLFRTFAHQLELLYSNTDRIRLSLLDELINNLGVEPRMARPAQTVVRFHLGRGSQVIPAGTELLAEAQSGERLTFATDVSLTVSDARIAFAATYQGSALQMLRTVDIPESMLAQRPSPEPVEVNLGPNPALFLAIENLPPSHLSRISVFFELAPDGHTIRRSLEQETWCLIAPGGELSAKGILRPRPTNGGIRQLEWLLRETTSTERREASADEEVPTLPEGFYGSRVFLLPVVEPDRRFTCKIPRGMESALTKIFGRETMHLFGEDRAWLRVSMPRQVPSLQNSIGSIVLNAMTGSNVECFNQTVWFNTQGTCIPIVQDEGGAAGHLVAPLSIVGESTEPYLPAMQPSIKPGVGRFTIRNGRIDLQPGLCGDGRKDSYANLRLWVTKGTLGNKIGPGQITGFLRKDLAVNLRLSNPAAAAGGTNGEEAASARARFATALMSRDRIVTRGDVVNAVCSYDTRILDAQVTMGVTRTEHGLQRIEQVTIRVNKDDFVDPAAELSILKEGLQQHLISRLPHGTRLSLDMVH